MATQSVHHTSARLLACSCCEQSDNTVAFRTDCATRTQVPALCEGCYDFVKSEETGFELK